MKELKTVYHEIFLCNYIILQTFEQIKLLENRQALHKDKGHKGIYNDAKYIDLESQSLNKDKDERYKQILEYVGQSQTPLSQQLLVRKSMKRSDLNNTKSTNKT